MENPVNRALRKFNNLRVADLRKLHLLQEPFHLQRVFDLLDVDCVFDVGANYGQYAQMLRDQAKFAGQIISFEPIPEAAESLRQKSKADPDWTVEEIALSAQDGTCEFHVMSNSEFSSLGNPTQAEVAIFDRENRIARSISVKTETLSSAFDRLRQKHSFARPFLKLDTQGYDVAVLKSGLDVLPNFLGLQSELAIKKIYEQSTDFQAALALYHSLGFELSAFVPNNAGHFPALVEIDCIMLRKDIMARHLSAQGNGSAAQ
jgi:FkbM family methyltransferase